MSPDSVRKALLQRLESLERAGVSELPRRFAAFPRSEGSPSLRGVAEAPLEPAIAKADGGPSLAIPAGREAAALPVAPAKPDGKPLLAAAAWQGAPDLPPAERRAALDLICAQVSGCERCRELATTRTQTVFGVGNPTARLCFMGEAPGADEDAQGEPFVGRAGQLLNKIIEACTLRREDVFILNTIKCRPPGNRNPLPAETANCREYLDRQLEVLQPEFICCLGSVAAQSLLGMDSSIGKLRKRFFDYRGSRVLCTYHPAYLLRNPAAKKDVWEDMQLLMAEMGIALPGKG